MPETAAWLATRPLYELFQLVPDLSVRKRRLFGVACLRRAAEWAAHHLVGDVAGLCERAADRPADRWLLAWARDRAAELAPDGWAADDCGLLHLRYAAAALAADDPDPATVARNCVDSLDCWGGTGEHWFQADLFRDVAGNPFRPVSFAPAWRTADAVGVARCAYDTRDFAALPVLADALQDAGCDHAGLLAHCRDEALTHVRGCWAVDLVLGLR